MRGRRTILSLMWLACCGGDDEATTQVSDTLVSMMTASTETSTTANTSETSGANSTSSTSSDSMTTSADGAPFFLSFSTNVGAITEGESVVFTATLSDPDGLDDIAGGTLFTGNGAFAYGPFVAAGQEGTYSITVSWEAIDQVEVIEFEANDMGRVFRAEFFDTKGNGTSQDATILLVCEGGGACGGACRDFQSDSENCGACEKVCEGGCESAKCLPLLGECINKSDGFTSCEEYCQGSGEQCIVGGCEGGTYIGYDSTKSCTNDEASSTYDNSCDHINTWGPSQVVVRCCCTDST